jgi:hypothetical protein
LNSNPNRHSLLSGLLKPALWLLAGILVIVGFASLSHRIVHGRDRLDIPFSHDQIRESSFVVEERTVGGDSAATGRVDSLIIHHRVWRDYSDSTYEGDIWVRTSDIAQSGGFKDHLVVPGVPLIGYDRMLWSLSGNDSGLLPGVYRMLDTLRVQRRLDPVAFAKVVVSCVQDIPYALVLDRDCNPDLYNDPFTRRYLRTVDAKCSGFQRFGINTPVEFVGALQGDCDTRTLLLYTLLDHYGYDVAILSSEVYSHSLLGIVLPPLTGAVYFFRGKSYVLWETTSPQMPPGVISASFDDLSNWRISLTSKH